MELDIDLPNGVNASKITNYGKDPHSWLHFEFENQEASKAMCKKFLQVIEMNHRPLLKKYRRDLKKKET